MINNYCTEQKSFLFSYIKRLLILSFALSIAGIVIVFRIFEISIEPSNNSNQVRVLNKDKEINRGKIVDRNGRVLASNIYTYKLLAYPNRINDLNKTIYLIKQELPELNSLRLEKKLNNKKKVEVLLKKNITAPDAKRIKVFNSILLISIILLLNIKLQELHLQMRYIFKTLCLTYLIQNLEVGIFMKKLEYL